MSGWGSTLMVLLAFFWVLTLPGCAPPTQEAAAPAVSPVLSVGNQNNLYVVVPARLADGEQGFRYAQRDAAGAWPESFRGSGYGVPAAVAAWREALLVFFPSGRWGRFGPSATVVEVEESPAPAWKPVAACEDALAADAFGWNEAGEPIHVRLGDGEPQWQRVDAVIEPDKALDLSAVRYRGRLYLVWREQVPRLPGAETEHRVRFVYHEGKAWKSALSRLRVGSAPLVAAAGEDLVCLYRRPAADGLGPWTLATYATADEDWHEVGPLTGTIPDGVPALARQGDRLIVVVAAKDGPQMAALDVAACGLGPLAPVPINPPPEEAAGATSLYTLLLTVALFGAAMLLIARRPRTQPKVGAEAPPGAPPVAFLARRAVAGVVDQFLIVALLALLILAAWPDMAGRLMRNEVVPLTDLLLLVVLRLGLTIAYFTIAEGATGRSIGKALLGLEVCGVDGRRATWKQAFLRNVLRIVDEMPMALYLVGLAFILLGPRLQRLGDRLARTLVVRSAGGNSSSA